jgi:hypothetical protein
MTEILFERSGGLMGRKISLTLKLDELPEEDLNNLEELLGQAEFFELPDDLTHTDVPDSFVYTMTVKESTRVHTVRTGETSTPDKLKPLIEELNRWMRMQR